MVALNHLSALTAGYFGKRPKVTQRACPTRGPTLRFGSLRSGDLRAHAAYNLLRKSTSRAFSFAEGCYAPGPSVTCTQPPEVAEVTGGAWAGDIFDSGRWGVCFDLLLFLVRDSSRAAICDFRRLSAGD